MAFGKINAIFILINWIFNSIVLVQGNSNSCISKEKVPEEEFGSAHYKNLAALDELGYLKSVVLDIAQSVHYLLKLETPLRLCKKLSEFPTTYWNFPYFGWKEKTRDKFETEFQSLQKIAGEVLNDFVQNIQVSPELPREDQDFFASKIDIAKTRLRNAKIETNDNGQLLGSLNQLRSTGCPNVAGSTAPGLLGMNKFAQGPTLVPMRKVWPVESSTTQHVIVNPSATQNNLSEPQLAHSSKGLPEHQPSPPKYQPPPGNFALKPVDQSSSSRISSATAPSSEGNSVGVPQFRINSNWRKDIPQPSQAESSGTQSLIVDPPATQTKLSETPPANSLLGFPERQRQLSLLKQTQLSDKVAPKSVDPPSSSTTSATPEPSSGRSPVGILRTGSNRDWLKPIAPPHQDKPSTTQQLLVNPPANENIPPKTPPSYSSNSLPERQLSLPKYQPQQESSDFAFKPVDLPSTPKASSSLEPISESKFKIHEWRQPNPQPLEVIPVKENSATVARPLPASETDGHRHKPVYVSKDGRILGPADGSYIVPATTADPSSGSHIDHMHKPVHETASGRAALGPSDRKYDGSATAASPSPDHVHRPVFVHAPSERAAQPSFGGGTVYNNDPRFQSQRVNSRDTGGSFSRQDSGRPAVKHVSASNPVYELQTENEFRPNVLEADKPVIVQFHAPWCGPCRAMEKPLTTYVKEKQGGLYLVKINKDNFESFCSKNGVQSLPKMHVYVGGERKEESGYKEGEALRQLVNKYCP